MYLKPWTEVSTKKVLIPCQSTTKTGLCVGSSTFKSSSSLLSSSSLSIFDIEKKDYFILILLRAVGTAWAVGGATAP